MGGGAIAPPRPPPPLATLLLVDTTVPAIKNLPPLSQLFTLSCVARHRDVHFRIPNPTEPRPILTCSVFRIPFSSEEKLLVINLFNQAVDRVGTRHFDPDVTMASFSRRGPSSHLVAACFLSLKTTRNDG